MSRLEGSNGESPRLSFKKAIAITLPLSILCLVAVFTYVFSRTQKLRLTLELKSSAHSITQLYFDTGKGFNERNSVQLGAAPGPLSKPKELAYELPATKIRQLRFDPLTTPGTFSIRNVIIRCGNHIVLKISPEDILPLSEIASRNQHGDEVEFSTAPNSRDSNIVFKLHKRLRLKEVFLLANFWLLLITVILLVAANALVLRLRVRIWSFVESVSFESKSVVGLCFLPFLAYLPAWLLAVSDDPIISMAALAVGGREKFLAGGTSLDPNTGFTTQALGMLSAKDWLHGSVPWWNPFTGVGLPLAGEMQSSSFFLPFILLLRLPGGLIWLRISLQVLAGLATFFLLRRLRVASQPALLGAALYEFNGAFAWISHAPMMPIPFLPLLLLGIERAFEFAERGRSGGWIMIASALAYSLYAGFPETAYLDGLLAAVWVTYKFAAGPSSARPQFARKILAGAAIGILLSLPIVVPFLEYQRLSAIGHQINSGHLRKAGEATVLLPYIYGPIGAFGQADSSGDVQDIWGAVGGYLGLTTVFLSLLSLLSGHKNRSLRWILALWIALFLARTFNFPGSVALFHFIPAMDLTQIHRYAQPSCELAGTVLSAFALNDWWVSKRNRWRPVWLSIGIASLSGAFTIWLGWRVISNLLKNAPGYSSWFYFSMAWAAAILLPSGLILAKRPSSKKIVLLGTLLIADVLTLFAIPIFSGLRNVTVDLAPVRFLQSHLGLNRVYTLGPLRPNYSAFFGFASINHNAVPVPANWVQYVKTSLDPAVKEPIFVGNEPPPSSQREQALREHLEAFKATGVKYVLTNSGVFPFGEDQQEQKVDTPRLVYEDGFVNIFELAHPASYFEAQGGPCKLYVQSREVIRTSCIRAATLIRRELFYPGWHAAVNGLDQTPTRTSSIFEQIKLPAGDSQVVFRYSPSYFYWTLSGALLGLLAIFYSLSYGGRTKGEQHESGI